jgi:hypothetical protein
VSPGLAREMRKHVATLERKITELLSSSKLVDPPFGGRALSPYQRKNAHKYLFLGRFVSRQTLIHSPALSDVHLWVHLAQTE